jgi:hypothetical protein
MNDKDIACTIRDSWVALSEGDFLEPNILITTFIKYFKDLEDEGIINFNEKEFKDTIYSRPIGT